MKFLWGPINKIMNFSREKHVLHDVIGNAPKTYLSPSSPTSYISKIDLPTSKFVIDVV